MWDLIVWRYLATKLNNLFFISTALIALRARDRILARNKSIVQNNVSLVEAFLSRHPDDFSWVPPRGGCCGFMRFLLFSLSSIFFNGNFIINFNRYLKASTTNTLDEMAKKLVDRFGVLILPGNNFPLHIRAHPTLEGSYLRIQCFNKFSQFDLLLQRLICQWKALILYQIWTAMQKTGNLTHLQILVPL